MTSRALSALSLLNEMQAMGVKVQGARWGQSLLLQEMQVQVMGVQISFSAAISPCEKGGPWQHALSWLKNGGRRTPT